jgi:hypothetical protein
MRPLVLVLLVLLFAACSSSAQPDDGPSLPVASDPPSVAPSAEPTSEPTPEPSASPSPEPSESQAPRALIGVWRTTLAGQPLSLSITETSYRIVRGGNVGNGSVRIEGDVIDFFDSDLCTGTGSYRWAITDGALTFSPLVSEPCTGRAEAVLVRYTDYSPPSGG